MKAIRYEDDQAIFFSVKGLHYGQFFTLLRLIMIDPKLLRNNIEALMQLWQNVVFS